MYLFTDCELQNVKTIVNWCGKCEVDDDAYLRRWHLIWFNLSLTVCYLSSQVPLSLHLDFRLIFHVSVENSFMISSLASELIFPSQWHDRERWKTYNVSAIVRSAHANEKSMLEGSTYCRSWIYAGVPACLPSLRKVYVELIWYMMFLLPLLFTSCCDLEWSAKEKLWQSIHACISCSTSFYFSAFLMPRWKKRTKRKLLVNKTWTKRIGKVSSWWRLMAFVMGYVYICLWLFLERAELLFASFLPFTL